MEDAEYDVSDLICVDCIEDEGLRRVVGQQGTVASCAMCGNDRISVTIAELAEILDPVLREHYRHGEFIRRYGIGDDDGYWEEQQGEDLSSVIQEVIGQFLECERAVIQALIDSDPADPQDGEDAFYDDMVSYVEVPTSTRELHGKWDEISDELKTSRRFFSDRARTFFDWLFEGIEALPVSAREVEYSEEGRQRASEKLGVVQEWPSGTVLFRSRRADDSEDVTRYLLAPGSELAPPVSRSARAGRMNAQGVTVFYGAVDQQTCLAEMRPSIGGHIVVGSFETTRPLRLLDFHSLDRAYGGGGELSFFDPSFKDEVARRKFRRQLHRLISQPVLAGHDAEYLITQVLAEYLAHVRANPFDGLLFASAQHAIGTNVVLFPKVPAEEVLDRFSIKFVEGSATLHQTKKITYEFAEIRYSVVGGSVYRHYYDGGDEDDYY